MLKKKTVFHKEFSHLKVIIVQDNTLSVFPVADMFGDSLEYENGVLKLDDADKYLDFRSGGLFYVFNLDLPAKVEAENLKLLRRSVALKNIFTFDRNKKFDLIAFMPWIIIVLLVFFK